MTRVRTKYLRLYRDGHSVEKCCHRKVGVAIVLNELSLVTPEFSSECVRLSSKLNKNSPITSRYFSALITKYQKRPTFTNFVYKPISDIEKYFKFLSSYFVRTSTVCLTINCRNKRQISRKNKGKAQKIM